jgi:ethanolamine utilization protein EutP (predicted NTPase)
MTDDKIIMKVEVSDEASVAHATSMLKEAGAEEVKEYGK